MRDSHGSLLTSCHSAETGARFTPHPPLRQPVQYQPVNRLPANAGVAARSSTRKHRILQNIAAGQREHTATAMIAAADASCISTPSLLSSFCRAELLAIVSQLNGSTCEARRRSPGAAHVRRRRSQSSDPWRLPLDPSHPILGWPVAASSTPP